MGRSSRLAILMLVASFLGSIALGDEVLHSTTGFYHSSGRIPKSLLGAIAGALIGLFLKIAWRTTENRFRFGPVDFLSVCLLIAVSQGVLSAAVRYSVNDSWWRGRSKGTEAILFGATIAAGCVALNSVRSPIRGEPTLGWRSSAERKGETAIAQREAARARNLGSGRASQAS